MRTLEKKTVEDFCASIRFIVWTSDPETKYTKEELGECLLQALNAVPWVNSNKETQTPAFVCGKRGENDFDFGPPELEPSCERMEGPHYRSYEVKLTWYSIEIGKVHAFSNFARNLNQRFRAHPPENCYEILTDLDFTTFLGPKYPYPGLR